MPKTEIKIGDVFSRLTVLEHDGTRGKNSYLKCRCSCGMVKSVRRDSLVNGDQNSCGCLANEIATAGAERRQQKRIDAQIRDRNFQARLAWEADGGDPSKCEHGCRRSECGGCKESGMGGGAICEHGGLRSLCRSCKALGIGGGSLCEHERVTSTCSVCSTESVFHQYQYKSAQRGLTFRLTLDEFTKLVSAPCHYCGENPGMGIDRVDNRIGYLTSNVVASCSECNFMKRVMDKHRFINRATKIAQHQQKDVIAKLKNQVREQQAMIAFLLLNQIYVAPQVVVA